MSDKIGNFQNTWLWKSSFCEERNDCSPREQGKFKQSFLSMREIVLHIVENIKTDLPYLTDHGITHLDALWEMANIVTEDKVKLNPAEAFVFGASVLIHDAGLSLVSYPNGFEGIKETKEWQDTVAQHFFESRENDKQEITPELEQKFKLDVLRRLHAKQAEKLATNKIFYGSESAEYLIENAELRNFYGPSIGEIAHSHGWSINKVEQEFSNRNLGSLPSLQSNLRIDILKIACLLRVADAIHIDGRRAPGVQKSIVNPQGDSKDHWIYQSVMAKPQIEENSIVFTSGSPIQREFVQAWWLAYDAINVADKELRDSNQLLSNYRNFVFRADRVKGAGSPELFSKLVKTKGWRPVESRIKISSVSRIIESMGGSKLYGDDPVIPLRELIQNSADSIRLRREVKNLPDDWGQIKIKILRRESKHVLVVEDNGMGMSENILVEFLLDFGKSYWHSEQIKSDFPGIISSGMKVAGKFGIGFYSTFMLGKKIKVYSRHIDLDVNSGRVLEFQNGLLEDPIIYEETKYPIPTEGGTSIEIVLDTNTKFIELIDDKNFDSIKQLICEIAPTIDVEINLEVEDKKEVIIEPNDWKIIDEINLMQRFDAQFNWNNENLIFTNYNILNKLVRNYPNQMQLVKDKKGNTFGRAMLFPIELLWGGKCGHVTVSGLSSNSKLENIAGFFFGEPLTIDRRKAGIIVPNEALANWSTEQACLIARNNFSGNWQSSCAEIVLENGGEIGNLKIIQWDNQWLSESEFIEKLNKCDKVFLSNGEIRKKDNLRYVSFLFVQENITSIEENDEEEKISYEKFEKYFRIRENIAVVHTHSGIIFKTSKIDEKEHGMLEESKKNSKLFDHIKHIVKNVWGNNVEYYMENMVVGTVKELDIYRDIMVCKRC